MSDLQQTVPKGYKRTEVGVIPVDWETGYLGDNATFVGSGKTNTKNKGDFQLYGSTGVIGSCALPEYTGPSILVARVGANAGKLGFADGEYGVSDNTILIKLSQDCNLKYFQYWLTRRNLNSLVFGSGQPLITGSQLKELMLPFPKKEEQTAIANTLADVDALLTELEKLIAKKQAIKTATMQQLLTGKTRLPQFAAREDGSPQGMKQSEVGYIPKDWTVKNVSELTDCTAGGTPSTKVPAYWGGNIPWMSSGELHLKRVFDVEARITDLGLANSSTKYIPEESVLIGLAGQGKTRGTVAISKIKLCTNQSIAAIFPSKGHSTEYLFYNLDSRYEELRGLSTGDGGRGGLNLTIIRRLKMPYPKLEEQKAIANILSDMDSEIQTLEQRLAKTRQIKQGMMQELLTGRTRLPRDKE